MNSAPGSRIRTCMWHSQISCRKPGSVIWSFSCLQIHTHTHQNACSVTTGRMFRLTYWISQLPASKVLKYMSEDCKPQPEPPKLDSSRHRFTVAFSLPQNQIKLTKKLTFLQVKRRYNSWRWSAFRRKPHPHHGINAHKWRRSQTFDIPFQMGGGAQAFVRQALMIQLSTRVMCLHNFIQYLQLLCWTEGRLLSASSCFFSFYSSTLPTSVWTSSPITSRPQPPMLLLRPYLCFPSFHLAFFVRRLQANKKNLFLTRSCWLTSCQYNKKIHIAFRRLGSESEEKMCRRCTVRVGSGNICDAAEILLQIIQNFRL